MNKYFIAGGTLAYDTPSYIERPADTELIGRIENGELCFILNTRQFGKSSLVVRTIHTIETTRSDVIPIFVDFSSMGMADVSGMNQSDQTEFEERWYQTLLYLCAKNLNISPDPFEWWPSQKSTNSNRFKTYLRDFILTHSAQRLVYFFDEVDSIVKHRFSDDFFATIRAIHNEKAYDQKWERLSFVLIGAASPHDLIKNKQASPFNVGRSIYLHEFTLKDIFQLREGFSGESDQLLKRIHFWTSGHPYLTQKICQHIVESEKFVWLEDEVDEIVHDLFLSESARVQENNLLFAGDRILQNEQVSPQQLLHLYGKVYDGKKAVRHDRNSLPNNELLISGLVKVNDKNLLEVRNNIYRHVFNKAWINGHRVVDKTVALVTLALVVVALFAFLLYQLNGRVPPVANASEQPLPTITSPVFTIVEEDERETSTSADLSDNDTAVPAPQVIVTLTVAEVAAVVETAVITPTHTPTPTLTPVPTETLPSTITSVLPTPTTPSSPTSSPPTWTPEPPTQPPSPPTLLIDNLQDNSRVTSPVTVRFSSPTFIPEGWTAVIIVKDPVGGLWPYTEITNLGDNSFEVSEVWLGGSSSDCNQTFEIYAVVTEEEVTSSQTAVMPSGTQNSLTLIRDCPNTVTITSPTDSGTVSSPVDVYFTVSGDVAPSLSPFVIIQPSTNQLFVWPVPTDSGQGGNFILTSVNLGIDDSDCGEPFTIYAVLTSEQNLPSEIPTLPDGPSDSVSVIRSCN